MSHNSLFELAEKYKLDKSITTCIHNYIPAYTELFENIRSNVKILLEIGVGSVENGQMIHVRNLGYKTGNSLRCWRDYFNNSSIYGIDIYETNLEEERITTYKADQSNNGDLDKVMSLINSPVDIIIDDGSHDPGHQMSTFMFLEKFLSTNGVYVIEDIQPVNISKFRDLSVFPSEFKNYILSNFTVKCYDTRHTINRGDDFMMAFIKN